MAEECLICKEPLIYLEEAEEMVCAICHKKEAARVRCVQGHYICDACHSQGLEAIYAICQTATSTDPIAILEKMMDMPFCHMHGPEHHVLVGAALLTAYKNAGGKVDFDRALREMVRRGRQVPGGVCGFWGTCGAGISTGIFLSLITDSSPLSGAGWGLSNEMTSRALNRIAQSGGPRCCKRDSYSAILSAIDFVQAHFGIEMTRPSIRCRRFAQNNQCLQEACPYHPKSSSVQS